MPNTLAFDLGGSSLRVGIVAEDGTILDFVRKELRITQKGQQEFDADPLIWWSAFGDACADLTARGQDLSRIGAVAGCGFTRTQVFLDRTGTPLRPAITFQDSRAADMLADMRTANSGPAREILDKLGPFDPLARLLWLREHEPDHWTNLWKVVEPKDYLNMMLTGVPASDMISQTPMSRILGGDAGSVLTSLGIDPSVLPDTLSPFDKVGEVRPDLPAPLSSLAGAPVHCGSIDTWSCVLGSGALTPGSAYSISGTSDVFGVITSAEHSAKGLLSVRWGPDLWQLGGPSQGAASRLDWARARFCPGEPLETALTRALATARSVPLFLPYLDGERTPWWDSDLRGAFLGLNGSHDNDDLLCAVAEGINYLAREILLRAEGAIGARVDRVVFSGGMAANPELCRLKADVLGRPVLVPKTPETGLSGSARVAAVARGDATPFRSGDYTRYESRPDRRGHHDQRFDVFRRVNEAIRRVSHDLALVTR